MPLSSARVIIIGGGPAGLTAALELVRHSTIKPLVLEATPMMQGGIPTIEYKGNRMDIGGHRFFSKSMGHELVARDHAAPCISTCTAATAEPRPDRRSGHASAIRPLGFFSAEIFRLPDIPFGTNHGQPRPLAPVQDRRHLQLGVVLPTQTGATLPGFFINRFGQELYRTFFKDYTEKGWGFPRPDEPARAHSGSRDCRLCRPCCTPCAPSCRKSRTDGIQQKKINTSLIERFLYPKMGLGQMWHIVREKVTAAGGEVRLGCRVTRLTQADGKATRVEWLDAEGSAHGMDCDFVISSMPIKDLINAMTPSGVRQSAKLPTA